MEAFVPYIFLSVFIISLVVGLICLANLVWAVFRKSIYVPELSGSSSALLNLPIVQAKKWIVFFLLVSLVSVTSASYGVSLFIESLGGLGAIERQFPRPWSCEVLYLTDGEGIREVAYGCGQNTADVYKKYQESMKNGGWVVSRRDAVLLEASKGRQQVRLTFIRKKTGDDREYPTKIILVLLDR